eukprot:1381749-Amorphochlora_amoeboformis.AAC.1
MKILAKERVISSPRKRCGSYHEACLCRERISRRRRMNTRWKNTTQRTLPVLFLSNTSSGTRSCLEWSPAHPRDFRCERKDAGGSNIMSCTVVGMPDHIYNYSFFLWNPDFSNLSSSPERRARTDVKDVPEGEHEFEYYIHFEGEIFFSCLFYLPSSPIIKQNRLPKYYSPSSVFDRGLGLWFGLRMS